MRKLLQGVTGSQKISMPVIIVNCGIAKMFVGELVETARVVMGKGKKQDRSDHAILESLIGASSSSPPHIIAQPSSLM
ncbi:hypothetical protein Bca52824_011665 [Brassica carinata]|uniref:TAFII28-like protein domain-containing protein n=1 Tax=Brassica carinata TaxID=52824 RepID=A0A8X7VWC4_BRACI|nr:hypothetical protein Bca52824_011665 [Brassica carinata]